MTGPRFGLGVPNGGDFADPHRIVELARAAEAAGWDGLFLWDHVIRRRPWQPMIDPWVTLAAVAVATDRIVLGPMVTPLARRRVSVVARETATLDLLSNGRLRFGVGLGAPDDEFTRFGEDADPKRRARVLDESLDVLQLLWSGEPTSYAGEHLEVDDVQFLPRPVRGNVPIWVAGGWPGGAPFRRAARFEGVWPVAAAGGYLSVDAFVDCVSFVRRERSLLGRDGSPFDACFVDRSPADGDEETTDKLGRLLEGEMTWWIDSLDDPTVAFERHLARVHAGPPA
jgi:alkanesulfonate monooxygenase SsuD/methylene tetrahydromethanopterin reductase-like flavin-dependent oxidoreductase (luciferase family)